MIVEYDDNVLLGGSEVRMLIFFELVRYYLRVGFVVDVD